MAATAYQMCGGSYEISIHLESLTLLLIHRCFALSYACTAYGFAPRLKRKPAVCWVVLATLKVSLHHPIYSAAATWRCARKPVERGSWAELQVYLFIVKTAAVAYPPRGSSYQKHSS